MSALATQHLAAVMFYAALLVFERLRRAPALAIVRHPMYAYLARAALAALYFAIVGLDPLAWLAGVDAPWLVAALAICIAIGVFRRHDVAFLARNAATVVQATYLAAVVAVVEELIFRGAFVLVASATLETTALASVGASVAYVVWRAYTYRDRDPRSLALVLAANVALGVVAGLSRSLWPSIVVHTVYVALAGPPRASRRPSPSAVRP